MNERYIFEASILRLPKRWLNPQFIHGLDEAANIMIENLAQHLVRHRHVGFAAHVIAKLRLDHRERRLDIRPLVIVPHELLAVKGEVMKHLRAP